MTPVTVRVPLLVCAFLDTAKSRRDAVRVVERLMNVPDPAALVDAYYAQTGGEPWKED